MIFLSEFQINRATFIYNFKHSQKELFNERLPKFSQNYHKLSKIALSINLGQYSERTLIKIAKTLTSTT